MHAAVLLAGALSLVACGSGATTTTTPPADAGACPAPPAAGAAVEGSTLKVGIAFDIGGRGDRSFNDSAVAGMDKAKTTYGITDVKELTASPNEPDDAAATRLRQLADDCYNPIIAVGFKYSSAVETVATERPEVRFAIVDSVVDLPNVTPLIFAEEQGSFLVGAAAALKSPSGHIGFVGGVNVPLIQRFEAGFVQGATAVNPAIKIEKAYITPAGDFTGFQDPAKGNVVATGQLDAGADVIYHAAGASGSGVFSAVAAKNTAASPRYAIGVDSDQYLTADAAVQDVIITSMLKRVDVAVFQYITAVTKGDVASVPKAFNLAVDGVGYATSGGKVDDIVAKLGAFKADIVSGKITVKSTP